MKDLFFPERLGRLGFFVRCLALSALEYGLIVQIDNGEFFPLSYLLLGIAIVYAAIAVYLPRILDCGAQKWTLVLAIIPVVASVFGLYLLFRPTEFSTIFDDAS